MAGYESFYREDPLEVRPAQLPAAHYNLAHRLLVGGGQCLFVPIRSIQYLAVIDAEEIIFVDREAKHLVELAWRHFRPQARSGLGEPVPYEIHLYRDKAQQILPRLQDEFFKALNELDRRTATGKGNDESILRFPPRDK
ncbi:MAG TPA: hypothetical protein VN448_11350 [Gammaproteobacteria bacterium]|jgi:hypothetical protein|nr:hypothetical protein [Gammaproteobacteria bacterium]